jgi:hypothetical protein
MFAADAKQPLLKYIRSVRPDLAIDEGLSISELADLACDGIGTTSADGFASSSAAALIGGAEPGRPDTGGASPAWVEMTINQAIEAEREQAREFWCEVIGEVVAAERKKLGAFERRLDEVERRSSLEAQFRELEARLDARQLARDEAKRGPRGERGLAGERGPQGERGKTGAPGRDAAKIVDWKLDAENYLAVPVMSDGTSGALLDFRPLLQRFLDDTRL